MVFASPFSSSPFSYNANPSLTTSNTNVPQAQKPKAATTPEAPTNETPNATAPDISELTALQKPAVFAAPKTSTPSTSTSTPSAEVQTETTTNPPAAGNNQLPGWIASQLESGKISSYTNPNTHQTFYGPGVLGGAQEFQKSPFNQSGIFVSGPTGAGPISGTVGGAPVRITGETATGPNGQQINEMPPETPQVDYTVFGKGAFINSSPQSNAFSVSEDIAGNTWKFSGTVPTTVENNQVAKNNAIVDMAWQGYLNTIQSNPNLAKKNEGIFNINLDNPTESTYSSAEGVSHKTAPMVGTMAVSSTEPMLTYNPKATVPPAPYIYPGYSYTVSPPPPTPYSTYVAPALASTGQFLNQYVGQPAGNFVQDVLNTPIPSAQQLLTLPPMLSQSQNQLSHGYVYSPLQTLPKMPVSRQPIQQPITIGSLLNSASQSINKDVVSPIYNYLSTQAFPALNKYIASPLETVWNNTYNTPQARIHAAEVELANRQAQIQANQAAQSLINQQNSLMNQAQANSVIIGNNAYVGLSPQSLYAHLLGFSPALQNAAADISHLRSGISNLVTGQPQLTIPYNPAGNIVTATAGQQTTNINQAVNNAINSIPQITLKLANGQTITLPNPNAISAQIANYLLLQPGEAVANSALGIANPNQSNIQHAVDIATTGSSAIMPDKAALFGVGSGLINTGTNYLFGGSATPTAAFRQGYQYGAASAPFFEGAQALGSTLSDTLLPVENPYTPILEAQKAGEFETATPSEVADYRANYIKANPMATQGEIQQAVENYIAQTNEANSATLSLNAMANPYKQAVIGTSRLALRTAPTSTLFGGISAGGAYASGVRNPAELAGTFAAGYLGGTILQALPPAILDTLKSLKANVIGYLNPDTVMLDLNGIPLISEQGHLYYLGNMNTPNGVMPFRMLLSTTEQIQNLADLNAQINNAADLLKLNPDEVRSILMSNYKQGMTPSEFYAQAQDSLRNTIINHATPSDFPSAIAKAGQNINPPESAAVGDALRKAFQDLQGLYNAPETEFGTPQVYNYLGLRPSLTENIESSMTGSNKIGLVTQVLDKNAYGNFLDFVDEANNEGAKINLNQVKSEANNLISDIKELRNTKFPTSEEYQSAYLSLINKPEYAQLQDLYKAYNLYARNYGLTAIDSVRQALLGTGETEVVNPVGYNLRPIYDIINQRQMSYPFITKEPNAGLFEGTPLENVFPTTRFGTQALAQAVVPELTQTELDALKNYKYKTGLQEPITKEVLTKEPLSTNPTITKNIFPSSVPEIPTQTNYEYVFLGTPEEEAILNEATRKVTSGNGESLNPAERTMWDRLFKEKLYEKVPITSEEPAVSSPTEYAPSSAYYRNVVSPTSQALNSAIATTQMTNPTLPMSPVSYSSPTLSTNFVSSTSPPIQSNYSVAATPSSLSLASPSISTTNSSISSSPSVTASPSTSISPTASATPSSVPYMSPGISGYPYSISVSPSPTSPIGSYPFPSYPTSPSLSPLSYSGYPYPDYRRRSLAYPYPYPAIVGSDWYTNELATNPKLRPKYVSRYSPSLLPLILPGIERLAERSYSPLTETTSFRPIRRPVGRKNTVEYGA